jgi:CHAT domain-containing protein
VFARLRAGADPARAVALAKRELARDRRFGSPFYWAAYVVYGG